MERMGPRKGKAPVAVALKLQNYLKVRMAFRDVVVQVTETAAFPIHSYPFPPQTPSDLRRVKVISFSGLEDAIEGNVAGTRRLNIKRRRVIVYGINKTVPYNSFFFAGVELLGNEAQS
ncbi:hypothetical protein DFS33DRAFT_1275323 [Desarmillaria ectypa]|nr:hypothetical protein DFS33DRAFT_1275323 [Desarmillaria ectypa]